MIIDSVKKSAFFYKFYELRFPPPRFSKKIIESSPSTKKINPQVTSEFYSHQTHQNFIRNSKLDVFHQYCVQYSSFTALATFFLTIRDFTIAKYFLHCICTAFMTRPLIGRSWQSHSLGDHDKATHLAFTDKAWPLIRRYYNTDQIILFSAYSRCLVSCRLNAFPI